MAEDGREQAFRVGAGKGEFIGVANAGGLDLDQDFTFAFGPSRSTSTISSGLPASNATAARVFMSVHSLF
jgi:hypothetical protein